MKNILLVLALITGATINAKPEKTICVEYLGHDEIEIIEYKSEEECDRLCDGICQ